MTFWIVCLAINSFSFGVGAATESRGLMVLSGITGAICALYIGVHP